jgi:G:T/U-mismatch repair DNA glycosylase
LSKGEMDASVLVLEEKIERCRPEAVCVVGKSIWESIWRTRRGKGIRKEEFRYGWQDEGERMGRTEEWEGARVFVASSTSGLAATLPVSEKERIWKELGVWVQERRKQRGIIKTEEEL